MTKTQVVQRVALLLPGSIYADSNNFGQEEAYQGELELDEVGENTLILEDEEGHKWLVGVDRL